MFLGSRDRCLAIWSVGDEKEIDENGNYPIIKPLRTVAGNKTLDKVRAMVHNPYSEVRR